MSHAGLSDFSCSRPAPCCPKPTLSTIVTTTASVISSAADISSTVSTAIFLTGAAMPSSRKTVHVTVTSTILYEPAPDNPAASLIHQTTLFDLHIPVISPQVPNAPDITGAAFELYTPSAGPSFSAFADEAPTKSGSGPSTSSFPPDTTTTNASDNPAAKIVGITIGPVAFVFILGLALAFYCARHRSYKAKDNKPAPVEKESALEDKRQLLLELGRKRRERHREFQANIAAKNAAKHHEMSFEKVKSKLFAVAEDVQTQDVRGNLAHRSSGLAMHPISHAVSGFKDGDGQIVGQAL